MYEVFEKELNYISNEKLKEFIIKCLEKAPEYFYHIPASSSGKYHPKQDLGEGGLVRHTKAVVQVAIDLIRCEQFVKDEEEIKDIIVSACLLHDVIKNGFEDSGKTLTEHPLLACDFITDIYKSKEWSFYSSIISLIQISIQTHMGKWNTDKEGNEVLPVPDSRLEKLVHLADYIASRKYVDMSLLEE